jgi:hypothetical protein
MRRLATTTAIIAAAIAIAIALTTRAAAAHKQAHAGSPCARSVEADISPAEFAASVAGNAVTLVALTSSDCGNCRALRAGSWDPVVSRFAAACDAAGAGTTPRFVWVECSAAPRLCRDRILFPPVDKYPFVTAFVNGTDLRVPAESMLPDVNPLTGHAIDDSGNASAFSGWTVTGAGDAGSTPRQDPRAGGSSDGDDAGEEGGDGDNSERWTPGRLAHRVRQLAAPVTLFNASTRIYAATANRASHGHDASSAAAPVSALVSALAALSGDRPEPTVTVVAFVPRDPLALGAPSRLSPAAARLVAASGPPSVGRAPRKACTSFSATQLQQNEAAHRAFAAAAAFFTATRDHQRVFAEVPDEVDMATLMAVGDAHGEETVEHHSGPRFVDDDGEDDGGRDAVRANGITDADASNGIAASFVAEHMSELVRSDAVGQPDAGVVADTCAYTSRAVVGIFECMRHDDDNGDGGANATLTDAERQRRTRQPGACAHFSVKWRWLPATAREVVALLVADARPSVSVVADADAERVYPGRIIDEREPLSRAAARPLAFEAGGSVFGTASSGSGGSGSVHASANPPATVAAADDSSHPDPRIGFLASAAQPIVAVFVPTQSCAGRPDEFWHALRALQALAREYRNTTFALFDSLRYYDSYLRGGVTRPMIDRLGLGATIIDGGRRFSIIDALAKHVAALGSAPSAESSGGGAADAMRAKLALADGTWPINATVPTRTLDAEVVRMFLAAFWAGRLRPYGAVHRWSVVQSGPDVADAVRLKTARRVLDFLAGRDAAPVDGRRHDAEVRVLFVESRHAPYEASWRRAVVALAAVARDGGGGGAGVAAESDATAAAADAAATAKVIAGNATRAKLLRNARFAVVNGYGRGALPLEHMYPSRISSRFPLFICVDTLRDSAAAAGYASPASFVESTSERQAEMDAQPTTALKASQIADWIAALPCAQHVVGRDR